MVLTAGSELALTTAHPYTNFNTVISLFIGGCSSLNCVAGNRTQLDILIKQSALYYISVSGDSNESGSFQLSGRFTPGSPTNCSSAVQVHLKYQVETIIPGNFHNAGYYQYSNCTNYSYNSEYTAWYQLFVDKIFLLHIEAQDSQIAVYSGSCSNLKCQTTCYNSSCSTVHITTYDPPYYIAVSDTNESHSMYALRLRVEDVQGTGCTAADGIYLMPYTPVVRFFSTANHNPYSKDSCSGPTNKYSPTAWFEVQFSNSSSQQGQLTVNTCSQSTTMNTQVSVYSGACASLSCVANYNTPCASGHGSAIVANVFTYEPYYVGISSGTSTVGNVSASFLFYPYNAKTEILEDTKILASK